MKTKTATLLEWENVITEKQKKRLIEAVLREIKKFRKSSALKNLIKDSIILGQFDTGSLGESYTLRMNKNGTLSEDYSHMMYGEREYEENKVDPDKLRELIELCDITPGHITKIRNKIER